MDNYVGKRLDGRYEIQEIIGVGGMAVVYKAYDNIDDRIVAVKILKDEFLANEEFRRRFKNESKAIAVLSHPNIVKVYDVSFGDRLQYIVMEYIEGITLKEYIEQQKVINWKEAVHFVTQILRALQHAHDKGIVHRDVKPQNIMLLQNGTIKVTDFGIARFSRSETRTMTESAIGSVHYISPEQARGEITDDKADIYSVGVVLYEMLTGQLPFQSDSAVSVAIMQLQSDAKLPREINDSIPLGLEQITMHAMQKNTRDRYQSAAEMLLDLDEFKRNPSIKFDYSYFVDKEPTKFVDKAAVVPTQNTGNLANTREREKTIPILAGIAAGLIAVFALIIGGIAISKHFFGDDKITIPKFVGLNYETEIANNEDYAGFKFDVSKTEFSTQFEPGVVIKQEPNANSKIKKGETIYLTLATNGKTKPVPDVTGFDLETARKMLTDAGFKYSEVPQYDSSVEIGNVIKTSPEATAMAEEGSAITIYYSFEDSSMFVEVPDITKVDRQMAKMLLESAGLALGKVTEGASNLEKGQVISQSIEVKTKVSKGSKIDIVVSSGIPPASTATITINLPNLANILDTITATLNNEQVLEKKVLMDGGNYTFEVTGSGSNNKLKVLYKNFTLYSCDIDFTVNPAKLSNEKNNVFSITKQKVPNVILRSEDDAIAELKSAGFKTYEVIRVHHATIASGFVVDQSPRSTATEYKPDETKVILYVSKGPETTVAGASTSH